MPVRCSSISSVSALIVINPTTSSRCIARSSSSRAEQSVGLRPALLRLIRAIDLHQNPLPASLG